MSNNCKIYKYTCIHICNLTVVGRILKCNLPPKFQALGTYTHLLAAIQSNAGHCQDKFADVTKVPNQLASK